MTTLQNWDVVDANNNLAPPDGWPENTMQYSDVNNTGRAVQGTLRRFYGDINGSLDAAGVANAYTLTLNETGYTSYFDGMYFACQIPATNTGAVTIDVNGIGPATVLANGVALAGGELGAGCIHSFRYDGTNFQLINTGGGVAASGRFTNSNNPDLIDTDVALNIGATDPDTQPHLEIGPSAIQAKDDATTATATFSIGTLGSQEVLIGGGDEVKLFSSGLAQPAISTQGSGAVILGSDSNAVATPGLNHTALINIGNQLASTLADLGFSNQPNLRLRSLKNGGEVQILGRDIGGTDRIILRGDPDLATTIQGDSEVILLRAAGGEQAASTVAAASGGLFVNNTLTGGGSERVLTTSDLGTGGITVEDEGTPLATQATTLDFVGAGVTASGVGATKTITIPGGGGVTQPITTTYTFESPGKVVFDGPGGGGPTVTFENDGTDLNVTGEAAIGSMKFFGGLPLIVYEPGVSPTATVSMNHNGSNATIGTNTSGGDLQLVTTDVGSFVDIEPESVLTGRFRKGLGLDIVSDQVLATGTHGIFFRNSALTLNGRIGMFGGANLEIENFINGGEIVLTHDTSGGVPRTAFSSNPDNATGAVLYAFGNQAIQARAVSSTGTSSGRVSDASGSVFYDIGFNLMPKIDANVSGDFTIRQNVGKIIHKSSGGALTYTLNQQTATDTASVWNVANEDTETLTIAEGTGVTLKWFDGGGATPSTGNRSLAQGCVATIYKASPTEFWIWGNGIS